MRRLVGAAAFALLLVASSARADFNIAVVAGSALVNNSGAPSFTPTGNDSQIGADLITAQLNANAPVTLNTNAGGLQTGTIVISTALNATSSTLTLVATDSITINSSISGALTLITTAGTTTNINGPIGGGTPLTAVSISGGGAANLAGAIIATSGAITINPAVNLLNFITFQSTGGGDISLESSVTGLFDLAIVTSGTGLLGGPVSVASFSADPGGTTRIGANVTATNSMAFNDAVQIAATLTLASTGGGGIGFLSTIDSAGAPAGLTVSTSGVTQIQGAIGSLNPLASFATDGAGTTNFILAPITVTGDVTLNDPTSMASLSAQPETITSTGGGNVTFQSLTNAAPGETTLIVNTAGVTAFDGPMDPLAPFDSIITDAPGSTQLNGGAMNVGNATFNDPVTLGVPTTFFSNGGTIIFGSTVDGAFALSVTTSGFVTLGGAIGGTTPLASLHVLMAGPFPMTLHGNITTQNDIILNGGIVLTSSSTIGTLAGGAIGLTGGVNGTFDLALNTRGLTQISGNVGVSTPLASFTTDAPGTTVMFSNVTTTGPMFFRDPTTINGPATLTSSGSTVSFGGTLGIGGDLTAIGNAMNFNGGPASVTGAGALTFAPPSIAAPFTVGGPAALLTSASLAALANGFASITFGGAAGANTETITATTWQDPVLFRAPAGGGAINVTGDITRVDNSTFAFNAPAVGFAAQLLPAASVPSFVTSAVSPVGTPASGSSPRYFSLNASSGVTTSALTLTLCPAPANASAFFWNGSQWQLVPSTLSGGCPVVTLNGASTPTLSATSAPLFFAAAEDQPQVTLALTGSPIVENGGTATVTAMLSHTFSLDVTVNLGFSGTASPSDYGCPSVIVIPAGSTSAAIALSSIDDAIDEPDETVIVDILGVTNGVEQGTQQVTATILDDDPPPQLSIANVAVTEGSVATFTVQLAGATAQTVTVNYATSDGTATAPADYAATSGTLTFAPGQTSMPVSVATAADLISEPNETFTVTLSGPTNATIAVASATGTIVDASAPPQLSISNGTAAEGSPVTFTVQLAGATTKTVTVNYATSDGTATAPADYATTSGTLTFAPGQTSNTISVATVSDGIHELTETFTVTLSAAANATIASASATGTIVDNTPLPSLSAAGTTVDPGAVAHVVVTLAGGTSQSVTVDFTTVDGTATAPLDYAATSGTLTFAPGQTSQIIDIPTTLHFSQLAFTVHLSNAVNASIGAANATVDGGDIPTLSQMLLALLALGLAITAWLVLRD